MYKIIMQNKLREENYYFKIFVVLPKFNKFSIRNLFGNETG